METLPERHKAVRLHHPGYDVRLEELPVPKIEHPRDAIVKVQLAGLCGSDMHTYRGHEIPKDPFIMGHEFVGHIVALGDDSGHLKVGDYVVSPFTISCGDCLPCHRGFTSRCTQSLLFGHPLLPGAQAQYVRVPNASATLFHVPTTEEKWKSLSPGSLLLLSDILPTGCFAALQALGHPNIMPYVTGKPYPTSSPLVLSQIEANSVSLKEEERRITLAVVGMGPVGLCALVALIHVLSTNKCKSYRVVCIDLHESRRQKAAKIAETLQETIAEAGGLVEAAAEKEAKELVKEWTDGVGCEAVLEVVGYMPALKLAFDLVKPFGVIASVGVHQKDNLPFTGAECYAKNISLTFGRCPVRSMFPLALEILLKRQDIFGGIGTATSLVDKVVGMGDESVVKKSYEDFDKGVVGKVLFDPWK